MRAILQGQQPTRSDWRSASTGVRGSYAAIVFLSKLSRQTVAVVARSQTLIGIYDSPIHLSRSLRRVPRPVCPQYMVPVGVVTLATGYSAYGASGTNRRSRTKWSLLRIPLK